MRQNVLQVPGYRWEDAGPEKSAAGKTLLVGPRGVIAVLNFYIYALALDASSILVWYQEKRGDSYQGQIIMPILELEKLTPLEPDLNSVFNRMNEEKLPIVISGEASVLCSLGTDNVTDEVKTEFSRQLSSLEELLILCHSAGIPGGNAWDRGDLALMVVKPRQSSYRLYPQDWFNDGGMDLGYQWVTRVARNPETNQIHGEGIRIQPFILDGSLRNLLAPHTSA
jgi:hypothetical protein